MFGEPEVDIGEVDEHGDIGPLALDGADQLAVLAIDERRVAQHLGDAHVRDIFGADDALLTGRLHLRAAETRELRVGELLPECGDDGCAVGVARGFAGGEEDARVGVRRDDFSVAGWG